MPVISLEFLDEFAAAWSRHDADGIISMMTSDCVMHLSVGATPHGKRSQGEKELRAAIAEVFAAMPDAKWTDLTHFIAGDRGVTQWMCRWTRADGTNVETAGCDLFTFRDGLIAIKDSYRKLLTF